MKHRYVALILVVVVMTAAHAQAAQVFYDGFESPVINGHVTTTSTNWASATGSNAGLDDNSITGKTGDQVGWVGRYDGRLTTTNIIEKLGAGTNYTLTCDVSASRVDGWPIAIVELLAGTNVIAATTNTITTANDLSAQSVSMSFLAFSDHPNIGETLGISLSTHYNAIHNQYFYFDEMSLDATDTSGDSTPPTPATMTWNALPTSSVSNSITMQATNAVDANGVQYFFTNTVNGNVSGWQDNPVWSDTGLSPGVTYGYKVKARDKSANTNETNWSTAENAECEAHIILYETFENPSIRSAGAAGFKDSTWSLPPLGWTTDDNNRVSLVHDVNGTWPTTTPFGEQFANARDTHYVETTNGMSGHVLQAGYTYRVTCNTGGSGDRAGEENGVPLDSIVQLFAGASLVSAATNSVTLDDFSETNQLEFIPDAAHPNLGDVIELRLTCSTGSWWYRVIYDNIKVYAIPPKGGMLFTIR